MSNSLTCTCKTCVSHRHEVKDYHPEIPWKTSQAQKKQEIRDIMRAKGCDYQKAIKIYNGENTTTEYSDCE